MVSFCKEPVPLLHYTWPQRSLLTAAYHFCFLSWDPSSGYHRHLHSSVHTLGNNSKAEKQKDDTATQQRFLSWPSFWPHGSMSVALLTCYSLSNLPTSSLHSWCQGVFRNEGWRCAQGTRRSALPEGHSPFLLLLHHLWPPRKDSA